MEVSTIFPVASDARGEIRDLLPRGEVVSHVGLISTRRETLRGNHRHARKDEWFYLISGAALSAFRLERGGPVRTFDLRPGARVYVPRGVTHAYWFLAESLLLDLGTEAFDQIG